MPTRQAANILGKLKASYHGCLIAWGGSEILVSTYNVVVMRWPSSSTFGLSPIPVTFPAGKDSDQESLSVCRAKVGMALVPGKFKPSSGKCFVGVNGSASTLL